MERHLRRALLFAVIALFAVGCARPISGSAGPRGPRDVPLVLVLPADENGNLYGSVGPWDFLFDWDNDHVRSSDTLESTAAAIATYMQEHPHLRIRIDAYVEPRAAGPDGRALRARRIAAIRDALIKAGLSAERIDEGLVRPLPFKW